MCAVFAKSAGVFGANDCQKRGERPPYQRGPGLFYTSGCGRNVPIPSAANQSRAMAAAFCVQVKVQSHPRLAFPAAIQARG